MARPTYPGRWSPDQSCGQGDFRPCQPRLLVHMVEAGEDHRREGFPMRAVVVYESMFGNTHRVADAIGAGLTAIFDVSVMPVTQADPAQVKDADLIVVGGPTHVHGMTRAATREAAEKKAADPASATLLEPDAPRQDLRSWLDAL